MLWSNMLRKLLPFAVSLLVAVSVSAQSVPDYVIGPDDVLQINVFQQASIGGRYVIEADGTFTFPLIGRIQASGLTLRAFEEEMERRLRDGFFRNPQVSVTIQEYRSQVIFVVGEVRSPGTYPLTGGMTLIEAIAEAGSTTASASGEIRVVRAKRTPSSSSALLPDSDAVGASEIISLNFDNLEDGLLSENIALKAGDTIFVVHAESIYVVGEVSRPGSYAVQRTTTVLQAIALAGGSTQFGALNRIRIVRIVDGEQQELRVDLDDLVLPGDTIVVPERFF